MSEDLTVTDLTNVCLSFSVVLPRNDHATDVSRAAHPAPFATITRSVTSRFGACGR